MARLEVRPEAELDALETMLWYEGERDGLGGEFLQELRATFARIEKAPLQFPTPPGTRFVAAETKELQLLLAPGLNGYEVQLAVHERL